ncbi:MAG: YafY family transcriptional regulator [Rhodospirillales bacterium]|nr:YafY family transcriptional regulator [Rhodospirillales bacterium]
MRILRLFKILDHLRINRLPISAEKLASSLDVSVRTIYRDMATLQSMGAPVRGEGGVGYQLEKGYFLPPLHFDPDELDAIVLGMQLISVRGDEQLADAAIRASSKIKAALLEGDQDRFAMSPLLACPIEEEAIITNPFLSQTRIAIRKRLRLRMTYQDLKEQKTTRNIRPLGLTVFDKVWLLTAWCESKSDFRNFRVDRIEIIEETGDVFPREPGREFHDYLNTY